MYIYLLYLLLFTVIILSNPMMLCPDLPWYLSKGITKAQKIYLNLYPHFSSPQIKEESVVRLYDVGRLRADEEDFEDVDDDDENAEGEDDGEGVALGDDDEEDEDDDLFPLDSSFDTDEEVQRTYLSLFALFVFFRQFL